MKETTLGRLPFNETNSVEKSRSLQLLKRKQFSEVLAYFFVLLFTYASLRKLVDLNMFVKEVWGFSLFGSRSAVKVEFIILSSVELLVAILLSSRKTRLLGWIGTFILMVVINVAMFYMQQFSKIIPLYYGGIIPEASFIVHFIFNIIVLFLALVGILCHLEIRKENHVKI